MSLFEQLGLSEVEVEDSKIKISNKTYPLVTVKKIKKEKEVLSFEETAKKLTEGRAAAHAAILAKLSF